MIVTEKALLETPGAFAASASLLHIAQGVAAASKVPIDVSIVSARDPRQVHKLISITPFNSPIPGGGAVKRYMLNLTDPVPWDGVREKRPTARIAR